MDTADLKTAADASDGAAGEDDGIDYGRLKTLLGYHLRRAQLVMFQSFAANLAEDDISPGQLGVLLLVTANPGINQTRVGAALGIDRSTLVSIIDKLEGRGLLIRRPSPADRRSHALEMTRTGAAFMKALTPRLDHHEGELTHGMSTDERATLIDLLSRVGRG